MLTSTIKELLRTRMAKCSESPCGTKHFKGQNFSGLITLSVFVERLLQLHQNFLILAAPCRLFQNIYEKPFTG